LRDENDQKDSEIIKARNTSDAIIQKLTIELKNLKNECMCLLKREREVKIFGFYLSYQTPGRTFKIK
jgi:hypothetical protein